MCWDGIFIQILQQNTKYCRLGDLRNSPPPSKGLTYLHIQLPWRLELQANNLLGRETKALNSYKQYAIFRWVTIYHKEQSFLSQNFCWTILREYKTCQPRSNWHIQNVDFFKKIPNLFYLEINFKRNIRYIYVQKLSAKWNVGKKVTTLSVYCSWHGVLTYCELVQLETINYCS